MGPSERPSEAVRTEAGVSRPNFVPKARILRLIATRAAMAALRAAYASGALCCVVVPSAQRLIRYRVELRAIGRLRCRDALLNAGRVPAAELG
jgi:hypothetical protein